MTISGAISVEAGHISCTFSEAEKSCLTVDRGAKEFYLSRVYVLVYVAFPRVPETELRVR